MTVNVCIIGASVGVKNGQFNASGVTASISFGMTDLCVKELKVWVGARREEDTSAFNLHINDNSFCGPSI